MTTLKNKKGVSLVELIAVIVIMGIIVTVGGISVATIIENSNRSSEQQAVVDVMTAGKNYLNANPKEMAVNAVTLKDSLEKTTYAKIDDNAANIWVVVNANKTEFTFVISTTKPTAYPADGEATTVDITTDNNYTVTFTRATGEYKTVKNS